MSGRGAGRSLAAAAGRSIIGVGTAGAAERTRAPGRPSSSSRPSSSGRLSSSLAGGPAQSGGAPKPGSRGGSSLKAAGATSVRKQSPRDVQDTLESNTDHGTASAASSSIARPSAPGQDGFDDEMRSALLKVFAWCDADGDGMLSCTEFAAAQRLVAELCPKDFDDKAAASVFDQAQVALSGSVDKRAFLSAMRLLIGALQLPRRDVLRGLAQQTSGKASHFDQSVSELKHALVRNVSNLPDDGASQTPPPPKALWRTATGGSAFVLPPGAAGGPAVARVAFKVMQYLAMRTEDATVIDDELVSKMMGHRRMFKDMIDMTGEVAGVHVVTPVPRASVDIFLMKAPDAEQIFRVRIMGMQLSAGPDLRLLGMGGFDAGPIEQSEIPAGLLTEMRGQSLEAKSTSAAGASEAAPPPLTLARQSSLLPDADLQNLSLVMTSVPVARHVFRMRFKLAGDGRPVPNYLVLVPRLKAADTGHARYANHKIRIEEVGIGGSPVETHMFDNFILANIKGEQVKGLLLEHEFTSFRVRVQPRSDAKSNVVPLPTLSAEERACNLAGDSSQAAALRNMLNSQGLGRRPGERDIAFAVRLGRALCSGYAYDVDATEAHVRNLPPLIWEHRRGDCSAFNAGFVYALRSFGVPARVSLGFKYGRAVAQACGSVVAPHAQAEFFAEDIGWVPCDATLGVRRLGHEASSALSFVEWRPATMSVAEAQELAKVLQSPSDPWQKVEREGLRQCIEELHGNNSLGYAQLAAGLAKAAGLSESIASARTQEVMHLYGLGDDGKLTAESFARGLAAAELGKFRELGTGGGLAEASRAGVKFFEGGPYIGERLDSKQLKENMVVPEQMQQVMQHVGANSEAPDWSKMWPHGVFICSYEFDEKPLLP